MKITLRGAVVSLCVAVGLGATSLPVGSSESALRIQVTPSRISSRGGVLALKIGPVPEGTTFGYEAVLERNDKGKWIVIGVLGSCELPCRESTLTKPGGALSTVAVPTFGTEPVVLHSRLPPGLKTGSYRIAKDVRSSEGSARRFVSNVVRVR